MIKISIMTGKLAGLQAINTSPLANPYCKRMSRTSAVCSKCYSIRMVSTYRKNCNPAWERNGTQLSKPVAFWDVPKFKDDEVIRYNGHGELLNVIHAINLIKIAYLSPKAKFSLFTKRFKLVQNAIDIMGKPKNLQLVYSSPKINRASKLPKYFDKVFTVYDRDREDINCGARSCIECMVCYTSNGVVNVNERLK